MPPSLESSGELKLSSSWSLCRTTPIIVVPGVLDNSSCTLIPISVYGSSLTAVEAGRGGGGELRACSESMVSTSGNVDVREPKKIVGFAEFQLSQRE